MYISDGHEKLVYFRDTKNERFQLVVDDEAYAYCLNQGWTVEEEVRPVYREPVTEEMFRAARSVMNEGAE